MPAVTPPFFMPRPPTYTHLARCNTLSLDCGLLTGGEVGGSEDSKPGIGLISKKDAFRLGLQA